MNGDNRDGPNQGYDFVLTKQGAARINPPVFTRKRMLSFLGQRGDQATLVA